MWKFDDFKLTNKAGVWISTHSWDIAEGIIKNLTSDTFLLPSNNATEPGTEVIEEPNHQVEQKWIPRYENKEDYFILMDSNSQLFLTATSKDGLILEKSNPIY